MKVMIIGANGQLGSDLVEVLAQDEVIPVTHDDVEVVDPGLVQEVLKQHRPDCVINTAAFHNVAACEEEPERAFAVNAIGAWNVARACELHDAALLHISTDYVFDGRKRSPYVEMDLPMPLNVYGVSKLAGEYLIRSTIERHFIVRTSGLYGKHQCRAKGYNFVGLMLRLAEERDEIRVVDDEVLTPTHTLDLSHQIGELIRTNHYGLYHATNHGQCSWYEFACAIFDISKTKVNLVPTTSEEFPSSVKRPAYSVLQNKALEDLGVDRMKYWREALETYLEEKGGVES